MKNLKTALPVILVQSTCPRDQRGKGVQFQSTCNLCRESRKTQVWLCFLVLSFLSTSVCAVSTLRRHIEDVQISLGKLKPAIEKSDAMLYTPDVKGNCIIMSLGCYMKELTMVLDEEEIEHDKANTIFDLDEKLSTETNSAGCPPCETYPLKNATEFLKRLNSLLEEINSDAT